MIAFYKNTKSRLESFLSFILKTSMPLLGLWWVEYKIWKTLV